MSISKRSLLAMADGAIDSYQTQISYLETEMAMVEEASRSVADATGEARQHAAAQLITDPDAVDIAQIARETGAARLNTVLVDLKATRDERARRLQFVQEQAKFRDREALINPETGSYSLEIIRYSNVVKDLGQDMEPFAFKDFQWLFKRQVHRPAERGAFGKFLRVVTLSSMRENRALKQVAERLPGAFEDHAARYEALSEEMARHQAELDRWKEKHAEVVRLVREEAELRRKLASFEREAVDELRDKLVNHLTIADPEALHAQIRPSLRPTIAELAALKHKRSYFKDLKAFLSAEITNREQRISSIGQVMRKWRRSKRWYFPDKSKWLVEVPEIKRKSLAKQLGLVRTIRINLDQYDRYEDFSRLMTGMAATGAPFLAYDAFSLGAQARMPYEGFARMALPEVNDFRRRHHQDRADLGFYRKTLRSNRKLAFHDADWSLDLDDDDDGGYDEYEDKEFEDFLETAAAAYLLAEATEVIEEASFYDPDPDPDLDSAEAAAALAEIDQVEHLAEDLS